MINTLEISLTCSKADVLTVILFPPSYHNILLKMFDASSMNALVMEVLMYFWLGKNIQLINKATK